MTILGNAVLFLASLLFFALTSAVYKTPPKGGDAVMGYLWGMIFINLAFWICINVASGIIMSRDGFDWMPVSKPARAWIIFGGLFIVCLVITLSALFRHEPNGGLLRALGTFLPVTGAAILVVTGFILMNDGLRIQIPVGIYKWPLAGLGGLSIIGLAAFLASLVAEESRNQRARVQQQVTFVDENQKRILSEIDSCNVSKDIYAILVFTGRNQPDTIRNRAVAKIRSNPQWEQELLRLMETYNVEGVFQFLSSNDVDHPDIFVEPVNRGILMQASLIRESIRRSSHPSHFYPELFLWETERVIWTVDKFKGGQVDYLPAMKELRAAINEPSEYKKIKLRCAERLDQWISENSK